MSNLAKSTCRETENRDPRVRRTRKLLEDAFRSLIHEKHYSEISVMDITERATVNRATFYSHYLDKQDLSQNVLMVDLKSAIVRRFSAKPELSHETLVEFALGVFDFVAGLYQCAGPAATTQNFDSLALQQGLMEVVDNWLLETPTYQTVFPDSSREVLATVIASSLIGGAQRWVRSDPRAAAPKICREIVTILLPANRTSSIS